VVAGLLALRTVDRFLHDLIRLQGDQVFVFAGLWERWKSPEGETVETCTIITGRPNEIAASIHDRMPVILPPDAIDLWLSPTLDPAIAVSLLEPFPSTDMEAVPVSTRVNSPRNDDAECVAPLGRSDPLSSSSRDA